MPPCYVRDTKILTTTGEVVVQDLRAGDMLVTRFGALRALKWVGRRSYAGRFLGHAQAPVCFRAGSIADNVPNRDLYVSPTHAMVIMDRLVGAYLLVNNSTVTQTATSAQVDYFHLDLGVHDCVVADGVWSERYAEHNNRTQFDNLVEFRAEFPDHISTTQDRCLPQLHLGDPALAEIRAALLARVPPEDFRNDPGVHLLVDGLRVTADSTDINEWTFLVPTQASEVRLLSHATTPVSMGAGNDERRLGVCISDISIECGDIRITVQADHPGLTRGGHAVEQSMFGARRWTDGNCLLPDGLFTCFPPGDLTRVTVRGHVLGRYLAERST